MTYIYIYIGSRPKVPRRDTGPQGTPEMGRWFSPAFYPTICILWMLSSVIYLIMLRGRNRKLSAQHECAVSHLFELESHTVCFPQWNCEHVFFPRLWPSCKVCISSHGAHMFWAYLLFSGGLPQRRNTTTEHDVTPQQHIINVTSSVPQVNMTLIHPPPHPTHPPPQHDDVT